MGPHPQMKTKTVKQSSTSKAKNKSTNFLKFLNTHSYKNNDKNLYTSNSYGIVSTFNENKGGSGNYKTNHRMPSDQFLD